MPIDIDLSGRVAFVTGGSRGLGRADALTLARAGADVVVADLLVESELTEETDRYGTLATVARAVEELGSLDILVNNAGTLDHVAQFHEQSPELWERDLRERAVALGVAALVGLDLDVGDRDVRAGASEGQRVGAPEPSRSAGDKRYPAGKIDLQRHLRAP